MLLQKYRKSTTQVRLVGHLYSAQKAQLWYEPIAMALRYDP